MPADGPVSARERAQAVDAAELAADPAVVERAVVDAVPAYRRRVDAIAGESVHRIQVERQVLLHQLRTEEVAKAPHARQTGPRWAALLLAYLTAAAAFVLYFSRADFGVEEITPVAMGAAAASGLLYALACLPVRRSRPPGAAVAFAGWVLTALNGAAVGFGAYLVLRFEPQLVPWILLGAAGLPLTVALAGWCAWARRGLPPEAPLPSDLEGTQWSALLAEKVAEVQRTAAESLRGAYAALPLGDRAALDAERAAAVGVLASRGLDAGVGEPVGAGVVAQAIDAAARSVGVR